MAKSRKKGTIIMNTTTSTSKSAVRFTLNFFDKTITGTKASFNKANKGFGPEYEELTSKMAAHPDFKLVVKEQKTKTTKAKKTYEGMDYKFMEAYIATFEDASMVKEYEAVKQMAEDCGTKAYPLTKKWFLGKFSDMEGGFDMEAAKKDISNFRIPSWTPPSAPSAFWTVLQGAFQYQGVWQSPADDGGSLTGWRRTRTWKFWR